jgi:L-seryl-tRNA(Ser) seleniumtransferase
MSDTAADAVNRLLREIPSVTRMLDAPEVSVLADRYPRATVLRAVRQVLDDLRQEALAGRTGILLDPAKLASRVLAAIEGGVGRGLRRAINATGIVAHTGLGRSVLPPDALRALSEEARGYCLLQIDRATTGRTRRDQYCVDLITEITGAESATIVNNNCAATMIVLNTLAEGKEVVISRGQLVEIGGSFRIPDVLRRSGAKLVEVGCTNRTHLRDYEEAITEHTGLLMKVHTSNYRMQGFVKEVPIGELVELGAKRGVPVVDDLGAGAFLDLRSFGFPEEPLVQDSIRAGADLVTMSADKLIGGPQGGIVLGKKKFVDMVRKNPLARVVRVGKLTLIALEATLRYFLDRERALREHPTTRMLTLPLPELERRAREIAAGIGAVPGLTVEVFESTSEVGSGSYPAHQIPTFVAAVAHATVPVEELAKRLRMRPYGVFARIHEGRVVFDPRTLQEGEVAELAKAVREAAGSE